MINDPATTIGNLGNNVGLSTMQQIPNAWWNANQINNWGQYPDPQGNFPKPDINFILPANTPLPAILPGVVSGINTPGNTSIIPAYGAVITVKLDQPINQIATHYAYLHLAKIGPVSIGQHVNIGDILGYGGGNITAGSAAAAMGFALYPGDNYGFGQEWNRYIQTSNHVADQRLNPTQLIGDITGGKTVDYLSGSLSTSSGSGGGSGFFIKPVQPLLQPNDNVQTALAHIDNYLAILNPVPTNANGIGDWLSDFFGTLVSDAGAIIFRSFLIGAGVYICFHVIDAAIKGRATGSVKTLFKGTANIANATAPELEL